MEKQKINPDYAAARTTGKRKAYRLGHAAEWMCVCLLTLKGYQVLHRRWMGPTGEIDLIARRGNTLAFIEVKARKTARECLHSVTPDKQRRLVTAAESYLAHRPAFTGLNIRLDLMYVVPMRLPRHLTDAWRADR